MKYCKSCEEYKTLDCFYNDKNKKDGKVTPCKECKGKYRSKYARDNKDKERVWQAKSNRNHRKYSLKHKYNITLEDYYFMHDSQGGRCAICGSKDSKSKQNKELVVDHCHKTGQVRGLLCDACNIGIGRLNDDPKLIERALEYVKKQP